MCFRDMCKEKLSDHQKYFLYMLQLPKVIYFALCKCCVLYNDM